MRIKQYIEVPGKIEYDTRQTKNGELYHVARVAVVKLSDDGQIESLQKKTFCFSEPYKPGKYVMPFHSFRPVGQKWDTDFPVELQAVTEG